MKNRIFYLDCLRAFAIIMVVIIHCMSSYIVVPQFYGSTSWYIYIVLNAISRAGVPVFFMISGFLMLSTGEDESFRDFYKKRIPRLLIPLVAWNIICFLYRFFTSAEMTFDLKLLLDEFLYCGTYYHMWYLYTLVGIYLLVPFLRIIVKKCTLKQVALLVGIMVLRTSVIPFINVALKLNIYFFDPMFNGYLSLFLLGYVLGKAEVTKKLLSVFAVAGVWGIVTSICASHLSSSTEGINLLFNYGSALCHMVIASSVFIFAKHFCHDGWLYKVCNCISKTSLGIYLVHVLVLDWLQKHVSLPFSPIVCTVCLFAIAFPVSFAISFGLSKIKYVKKIVA